MQYSPHRLAYFAHKLTLRGSINSTAHTDCVLRDAQRDLNPHQIDESLFAASTRWRSVHGSHQIHSNLNEIIGASKEHLQHLVFASMFFAQRWALSPTISHLRIKVSQ
jgi:hypothetical protein